MKISIHGSYGTGNRGDEVILSRLLELLAEQLPGAEVTLLCRDEQRIALFIEGRHGDLDLSITPLHASFRKHPLAVLRACLRCDLFILGGGGLLWGSAPGNLEYWLQRPRFALRGRGRLAFYLPGIYGITGRRAHRLLGKVAGEADFVSVRDEEGLQQLLSCGVSKEKIALGADPAFLLAPPKPDQIQRILAALGLEGRRLVGLSARDWRQRLSAGIFASFVGTLLQDPEVSLLFFAMKTGGRLGETDTDDITVARDLLRTLPEEDRERVFLVGDSYRDDEMIALMGACDYLLAMRLHALIFATIAGTPFGAIAYDDKIRAYMGMLGLQEFLLDMKGVSEAPQLQNLVTRLTRERELVPTGPVPRFLSSAARLAARSQEVHDSLATQLRSWFPDARPDDEPGSP
jgi:polysaccharide pyruvyl transferase WcaK-like protein